MATAAAVAVGAAVAAGVGWATQRPEPHAPSKIPSKPDPKTLVPPPSSDDMLYSVDPLVERPIRYAAEGFAAQKWDTVPAVFKQVSQGPLKDTVAMQWEDNASALGKPDFTKWETLTWAQYYDKAQAFGRAMLHPSVNAQRGESAMVMGYNAPPWFIAFYGSVCAGIIVAGVYPTNSGHLCAALAEKAKGVVAVVDTMENANKYSSSAGIKKIVVYAEAIPADNSDSRFISFDDFLKLGGSSSSDECAQLQKKVDERSAQVTPSSVVCIIFTSGTTSLPKPVGITSDNMMFTTAVVGERIKLPTTEKQISVSFLPLSHIAATLLDIVFPLFWAGVHKCEWLMAIARSDALRGSITTTLKAAQPTALFLIPRGWSRFRDGAVAQAAKNPSTGLKKKLIDWARSVGTMNTAAIQQGGDGVLARGTHLAEKLVFSKVKSAFGLERCNRFITGSAPTKREVVEFFGSFGMPITEVYGMSETTGLISVGGVEDGSWRFGTVGAVLPATEVKLVHDAERGDREGEGEICVRGRQVMVGYLYDEQATRNAIDTDGWMHTGDLGRFDSFGLLQVSGRCKEILITEGGENIAVNPIENKIVAELPAISTAVLIAEGKKYCSMLVGLKQKPDGTAFTDELDAEALAVDPECTTVQDAMKSAKWKTALDDAVRKTNAVAASNACKVQKYRIMPQDVSVGNDCLTPTLKLKRAAVDKVYAGLIEEMYAEAPPKK